MELSPGRDGDSTFDINLFGKSKAKIYSFVPTDANYSTKLDVMNINTHVDFAFEFIENYISHSDTLYGRKLLINTLLNSTYDDNLSVLDLDSGKVTLANIQNNKTIGNVKILIRYDNKAFLSAQGYDSEGNYVGQEPYIYNFDTNTAYLVKDLYEGTHGSVPGGAVQLGNKIYFLGREANTAVIYSNTIKLGSELYELDITTEEIKLAADVRAGSYGAIRSRLFLVGGKIYFVASKGTTGEEIFQYDPANPDDGATKLTSISIATTGEIDYLTVLNESLYFVAKVDGTSSYMTYRFNTSTNEVSNISEISNNKELAYASRTIQAENGRIYFIKRTDKGYNNLFEYDPDTNEVTEVTNSDRIYSVGSYEDFVLSHNNTIYFVSSEGLFYLNKSTMALVEIQNLRTDNDSGYEDIAHFIPKVLNGKIFYVTDYESEDETVFETRLRSVDLNTHEASFTNFKFTHEMYEVGYFATENEILFTSLDLEEVTNGYGFEFSRIKSNFAIDNPIKTLPTNTKGDASSTGLTITPFKYKDKMIFQANTKEFGPELYSYDPNTNKASLIHDLNPGPERTRIIRHFEFNNELYFIVSLNNSNTICYAR
jgi:ELWxxDGT repeat protein